MAELLKLKMHVPEVIALQFATGKIVESTISNAPNQVMFTLGDGRRIFLPLSAADRIREAGIQAMQNFEIVKAGANDFRIRIFGEGSAVAAVPPAMAQAKTSAAQSGASRNGNGNQGAPPPQSAAPPQPTADSAPRSKAAMAAYKDAVDTFVEMKAYAQTRGLALDVRCEDVRCLAATFMIAGNAR